MAALERLTTRINIEMAGDTKRYLVSAKQGDKATRYVVAKLLYGGIAYTIPEDARVVFNVEKPDGKHIYNACTHSGSEVTVELTNQTLAVEGTAYCDIEVRTSDDTQLITSASFTIEIEKSIRNDDAILSSNEFTELENRIANFDDIETAAKEAEAARVIAENDRVMAEKERTDAENIRNQNEDIRIEHESLRQQNTTQAVKNVQDATAAAGKATEECIEVTERAENTLQNQEQLTAALNTATQIQQDVSQMQSAVTAAKEQVEKDKEKIEDTIQNFKDTTEGVQANVIEGVQVNGVDLTVSEDKKVNVQIPEVTPENIGAVPASKVLTTKEQVEANTDESNVAGATAVKGIYSNLKGLIKLEPFRIGLIAKNTIVSYSFLPYRETTKIVFFLMNKEIVLLCSAMRKADGYVEIKKILGNATISNINSNQYGTVQFSIDMDYSYAGCMKFDT